MKTQARKVPIAFASLGLVLLLAADAIDAHHSPIMFDTTQPVTIKGTVVRFDRTNPHSYLRVEFETPDGKVEWAVEGPAPRQLEQRGIGPDFFTPGDAVEACGYVLKPDSEAYGAQSRNLLVAEVVLMPGGEARLWSPYGNRLCRDRNSYTLHEN